jgi:hypothetical protein
MGLRRISRKVRFNSLGVNATDGAVEVQAPDIAHLSCSTTPAIYYHINNNYTIAATIATVCNATLARLPEDFTRVTDKSDEN